LGSYDHLQRPRSQSPRKATHYIHAGLLCRDEGCGAYESKPQIIIMRYKNVEFRPATENRHAEIVAWNYSETLDKETCFTLCWIKADKEGYYIETVGDRYVEYEDMEVLNHVAKYALRSLNVQFEFEERQY
jgi:hypothetical protein